MNMKRIPHDFRLILIAMGSVLLLWTCAAEGMAGGGPKDKQGPKVLAVTPQPGERPLNVLERITIRFDEMVNPLSVPASVIITPETEVVIRTRGKQVYIQPVNTWPADEVIHIRVSRTIRDYRENQMDRPLELFYSTGASLPEGKISGRLFDMTKDKIVEVGLFLNEPEDTLTLVRRTDAADDGTFAFLHVPAGKYVAAAFEGEISNPYEDIMNFRYGIQPTLPFILPNNGEMRDIPILMSDAVPRLFVKSVEIVNPVYGVLYFNDGSTMPYIFPLSGRQGELDTMGISSRFPQPGDSIRIALTLTNRLESYEMKPYDFVMPEVTDTLAPKVERYGWEEDRYEIRFSEPVKLKSGDKEAADSLIMITPDTTDVSFIPWHFTDPFILTLDSIPGRGNEITCRLDLLTDYMGNSFDDTLLVFGISPPPEDPPAVEGGSISGRVIYTGEDTLIVKAVPVNGEKSYFTRSITGDFSFENLPPGDYTFEAFEIKNPVSPQVYFSGLWDPFQPAAEFGGSIDTVEVRKRWLVEGLEIYMLGKGELVTDESRNQENGGSNE